MQSYVDNGQYVQGLTTQRLCIIFALRWRPTIQHPHTRALYKRCSHCNNYLFSFHEVIFGAGAGPTFSIAFRFISRFKLHLKIQTEMLCKELGR